MNEFIEKNRGLLKFYCVAARIIGWALLLLPVMLVIWIMLTDIGGFRSFLSGLPPYFTRHWHWQAFAQRGTQPDLLSIVVKFVLPGLLALGVAQFIRYLSEKNCRPGWTLRCAEGILYLYAVLLVVHAIWSAFFSTGPVIREISYSAELVTISYLLITTAKVTILVGLGQILARVMPVIEESKTLV